MGLLRSGRLEGRRRLTLNLGLRYEYETPLVEADNQSVRGFDCRAPRSRWKRRRARALNPAATGVPLDQFHVQGRADVRRRERRADADSTTTPKNNFMPRVGGTYKLNDKTVLRGGYGMFYGFLGQRRGDVITTGFSSTTTMVPSLDNGLTFIETLSNPFAGGIQEPQGAAQGIADVPRPEHHVLRSRTQVAADAALADRHPARAARAAGVRGVLRRQPRHGHPDDAQHQRDADCST